MNALALILAVARAEVVAFSAWAMSVFAETGGGDAPSGVVIDLLNLQWWQTLIGIIGLLGLSPAPWLLGLAAGRIQFTAAAEARHQRELAAQTKRHEREMEAQRQYHADVLASRDQRYSDLQGTLAKSREGQDLLREQNEKLTDALVDSTEVLKVTNHALVEFNEIAKQATT